MQMGVDRRRVLYRTYLVPRKCMGRGLYPTIALPQRLSLPQQEGSENNDDEY